MAHAHTEVEGPPWRQPAPTTPRSDDSQQRAAACRSNPAPGPPQANGLREAAAAPHREWPRPPLHPHIHRRGTHRAEMVDAQPPRRHGRYCRRTAHPE